MLTQSVQATKPRSGKSGIVPAIQAPMVRLLGQPLRTTAIVCLHWADKDNSDCHIVHQIGSEVAHPVQTTEFREVAGAGQVWRRYALEEWGARGATCLRLSILTAMLTPSHLLARILYI
jgi:hypothetical protein